MADLLYWFVSRLVLRPARPASPTGITPAPHRHIGRKKARRRSGLTTQKGVVEMRTDLLDVERVIVGMPWLRSTRLCWSCGEVAFT